MPCGQLSSLQQRCKVSCQLTARTSLPAQSTTSLHKHARIEMHTVTVLSTFSAVWTQRLRHPAHWAAGYQADRLVRSNGRETAKPTATDRLRLRLHTSSTASALEVSLMSVPARLAERYRCVTGNRVCAGPPAGCGRGPRARTQAVLSDR